ncbi:phosphopantetheine-binding protein [Micromonospora aurantiaca]|uniref:acyl carrier protein n=1 Tax=Micromonospora aurantiaca (nom. illeg.) TaxID=47850 RepID=UPI0033B2AE9E
MDTRFEQILKSVAELPDEFEILAEQDLREDLDIDSLRLIDVVLGIEEEFNVELGEDALAKAKTAGQLWAEIAAVAAV